jgi:formylmethanofuran dehydrogenase subunit E
MLNKEKNVEPTSKSGNDAKPIVSSSGQLKEGVLAICDDCGRDILDDEVALARGGIFCYDCCKKMWGMD